MGVYQHPNHHYHESSSIMPIFLDDDWRVNDSDSQVEEDMICMLAEGHFVKPKYFQTISVIFTPERQGGLWSLVSKIMERV